MRNLACHTCVNVKFKLNCTVWPIKNVPLSNSVYSSVFTYNPHVLTRSYRYLTIRTSIEPHHIMCISLDINALIARFGDQVCVCKLDTLTSHQKQIHCPSTKFPWLSVDKLSDNNASDNGLSLSASV